MPYFLRGIKKLYWMDHTKHLTTGFVPADILCTSFRTKEDTLSIWKIEDNKSNLCRVILALSLNKNIPIIEEFEYVLINSDLLSADSYKIQQEDGTTKDSDANKTWHYNIKNLSAESLANIATVFYLNSQPLTMMVDEVEDCLRQCIKHINIRQVSNTTLRNYLQEFKVNLDTENLTSDD